MEPPKKARRVRYIPFIVPHTHTSVRPYALAIGQLTLAWNELHTAMAMLFCGVMGGGFVNQFLAVWHAIKVDRAQRDILIAAAKSHRAYVEQDPPNKKMADDIEWMCNQANALEDLRNDAIHSPLWGYERSKSDVIVIPVTGLGHVRATKLATKKDLLAEFRYCRDAAQTLTSFCRDVDDTMIGKRHSWPKRPRLPSRGETGPKKGRVSPSVKKAK